MNTPEPNEVAWPALLGCTPVPEEQPGKGLLAGLQLPCCAPSALQFDPTRTLAGPL